MNEPTRYEATAKLTFITEEFFTMNYTIFTAATVSTEFVKSVVRSLVSDDAKAFYREFAINALTVAICAVILLGDAGVYLYRGFVTAAKIAYESGQIVGDGYYSAIPGIEELSDEIIAEMENEGRQIKAMLPEAVFAIAFAQAMTDAKITVVAEEEAESIACDLGDWWLTKAGTPFRSAVQLKNSYQRAIAAYQ
jgi:hypothetical protein